MKLQMKCFDNLYTQNHTTFKLTFKKSTKINFFKPWPAANQNSKTFKNDKVNKHIPVFDIAKNKSALISGIAEKLT